MATMELDFDLSDDVRGVFAVDEAIMGPGTVVVVGDREEDVDELVSVALVKLPWPRKANLHD